MPRLSDKYIAGFLDSDGCIALDRNSMTMSFSQKTSQDEVLYRIQEAIGGHMMQYEIKGVSYSKLALYSRESKKALYRIKKHLVIKRHYAEALLSLVESVGSKHSEKITQEQIEWLKEQRRVPSFPIPNFPPRKWLAGYLDGDGCFSCIVQTRTDNGTMKLHIAASNYDVEGITLIHKSFGGFLAPMSNGRCTQYTLTLPPSKAKQLLGYCSKYMVVKRDQAEFILRCAEIGHYRDGKNIKAALKHLKACDHRLSEPKPDVAEMVRKIDFSIPPYSKKGEMHLYERDQRGRITNRLAG